MAVDARTVRTLLHWVNSLDLQSHTMRLKDLSNGRHLVSIVERIKTIEAMRVAELEASADNRLSFVISALQDYFSDFDVSSVVDINSIEQQDEEHIIKVLMLLLHWAVNSDNNQYFVGLITNADFEIQNYFKQIIESVMQQQQDGSFKDGQFCLPSMDNSDVTVDTSTESVLCQTPERRPLSVTFKTPTIDLRQTPSVPVSPMLKQWLQSPAATGAYRHTETKESKLYRELQAAKFDLMRQKHINDDLELEIREISSRAEKRDSSAESMQQHLSQMRDRLDELQHFESTCHMYEQQVQKYQQENKHYKDTERQCAALQDEVMKLQRELTACQSQIDEADGLFSKVSDYKMKLVGSELKVESLEKMVTKKDEEINKLFSQLREVKELHFQVSQESSQKDSKISELTAQLAVHHESVTSSSNVSSLGMSDMMRLTKIESENKILQERLGELDKLEELKDKLKKEESRSELYRERAGATERLENELRNERENNAVMSGRVNGLQRDFERIMQEKRNVADEMEKLQIEHKAEVERLKLQVEALKSVEEETRQEKEQVLKEREIELRNMKAKVDVYEEQLQIEQESVKKWKLNATQGEGKIRELEDCLKENAAEMERVHKAMEQIQSELKKKVSEVESANVSLQQQLSESVNSQEKFRARRVKLEETEKQNDIMREEKETLTEQVRASKEVINQQQTQIESLQANAQRLMSQVAGQADHIERLAKEKDEQQHETAQEIGKLTTELTQSQVNVESLRSELEVKVKQINEMQTSLDNSMERIKKRNNEIETVSSQLEEATQANESMRANLIESKNELEHLQSLIHTADVSHQNELTTWSTIKSEMKAQIVQLEENVDQKQAKFEDITKQQTMELQQLKQKQKEDLDEAKKANNKNKQLLEEQEKKTKEAAEKMIEWRRELVTNTADTRGQLEQQLKYEREQVSALERELEATKKMMEREFVKLREENENTLALEESLVQEKRKNIQLSADNQSLRLELDVTARKLRQAVAQHEGKSTTIDETELSAPLHLRREKMSRNVPQSRHVSGAKTKEVDRQPELKELHQQFDKTENERILNTSQPSTAEMTLRRSLRDRKGGQKRRHVGILPHLSEEEPEDDRMSLHSRMLELQRRNAATLPHLKSSYPVELQSQSALDVSDETIRTSKMVQGSSISETSDPLEDSLLGCESQSRHIVTRSSKQKTSSFESSRSPPVSTPFEIRRDTFTVKELERQKEQRPESVAFEFVPIQYPSQSPDDDEEEEPAGKRPKPQLPKHLQERLAEQQRKAKESKARKEAAIQTRSRSQSKTTTKQSKVKKH